MEYLEVDEARERGGLRLVLTAGVPGPWGEAAKAVFHVKKISYTPVRQEGGEANDRLVAWTGHANAPQAVYADERARTGWAEILFLAERLAPTPSLLPDDPRDRAFMFGLVHEIAGEMGFAWCRRLQILHPILDQAGDAAPANLRRLASRYGYAPERMPDVNRRVVDILTLLSGVLREQSERGSNHLVGHGLSAADLYWATFAAMLAPLPPEQCPMQDFIRVGYELTDEQALAAADPLLLAHRDRIYQNHLPLPLDF